MNAAHGCDLMETTAVRARLKLLAERSAAGHWVGELSSSALSTAVATAALGLLRRGVTKDDGYDCPKLEELNRAGYRWLAEHQNADGGWGDTIDSPSNLSTTTLCWAALGLALESRAESREAAGKAERWLAGRIQNSELTIAKTDTTRAGSNPDKIRDGDPTMAHAITPRADFQPAELAEAIRRAYGKDKTFSVPILTMCALTGRLGAGRGAWEQIPALPFELAALPHRWYRRIGLPVVSYALPALIAIGQVRHYHRPPRNPIVRFVRDRAKAKTLRVLAEVQPESGGYLEAAPLTGFVLMSLAATGLGKHPAARRAARFLTETARPDGSWPIDTNLATWVTTLAVGALGGGGRLPEYLNEKDRHGLLEWLLRQQQRVEHPYTHASPGGWAWTNLSGGVPDGDDTAGALLALWHLGGEARACSNPEKARNQNLPMESGEDIQGCELRISNAAEAGIGWLLDLQNRDGGVPTFCRGWGKLPFDRSTPDLTAHALRAWDAWRGCVREGLRRRIDAGIASAVRYLLREQREDGAWIPLWFGNQDEPRMENPLYGTSRVVLAADAAIGDERLRANWHQAVERAQRWILQARNDDGGWGAAAGIRSMVEETALALEALAHVLAITRGNAKSGTMASEHDRRSCEIAIKRGLKWLTEATRSGTEFAASPIGLYFARLWYDERLYPLIFTVSALERIRRIGRVK